MNKYIKTTLIFAAIWFFASVLNGVLSGISIVVLESSRIHEGAETFGLSLIFSFVFGVPMVGLVWFITLMGQATGKRGDKLFQFVLGRALFCSVAGSLIFIYTLGTEFKSTRFFIGLCIIISALASVLFFRKQIKANE